MSELQIGLLVLGGSVVGLVYGFNVVQEWRFRRKTRQSFSRSEDDVLLNVPKNNVRDGVKADRLEPVLLDTGRIELDDPEPTFEPEIPVMNHGKIKQGDHTENIRRYIEYHQLMRFVL